MSANSITLRNAEQLLQQGQVGAAKTLLKQIAEEEANPDAWYLLAKIAVRESEFTTAQNYLWKVLALDSERVICHFDLGGIALEQGLFKEALPHFENAATGLPNNAYVLLHLAMTYEKLDRKYEAAVVYKRCWASALRQGELMPQLPQPLQNLMGHGRSVVAGELDRLLAEVLDEVRDEYGSGDLKRVERLIDVIAGRRRPENMPPLQKPGGLFFPGLPEKKFFDRESFPWMDAVEANAEAIRDEYLALANDETNFRPYVDVDENMRGAEHWKGVNRSRAWSSCHIYRHGKLKEEIAARCRVTLATLEAAPLNRVPDHGPEAMFSVLQPGTRIPPHHGTINGRVIVHLPLIIPENCGGIRVAGEVRTWEFGKCLAFDDSYAHEAWNESDETRVVLIFDTWSPYLTEIEIAAFSRIIETVDKVNYDALGESYFRE